MGSPLSFPSVSRALHIVVFILGVQSTITLPSPFEVRCGRMTLANKTAENVSPSSISLKSHHLTYNINYEKYTKHYFYWLKNGDNSKPCSSGSCKLILTKHLSECLMSKEFYCGPYNNKTNHVKPLEQSVWYMRVVSLQSLNHFLYASSYSCPRG